MRSQTFCAKASTNQPPDSLENEASVYFIWDRIRLTRRRNRK